MSFVKVYVHLNSPQIPDQLSKCAVTDVELQAEQSPTAAHIYRTLRVKSHPLQCIWATVTTYPKTYSLMVCR